METTGGERKHKMVWNNKRFKNIVMIVLIMIIVPILIIVVFFNRSKTEVRNQSYSNSMLNYYQGNCLGLNDKKVYYRSQTDHYYLYSSNIDGSSRELLVSKVPGAIYPLGEWIYFISVSDNQELYRISEDGKNLEKILDQKVEDLILIDDVFYYRSEYKAEYDVNHMINKSQASYVNDKQYVYSYKIGADTPQMIFGENSTGLISDGEKLYVSIMKSMSESETIWYDISLDVLNGETKLLELPPDCYLASSSIYQNQLYYVDFDNDLQKYYLKQKSLDTNEERKIIGSDSLDIRNCKFYNNLVYIMMDNSIQRYNLKTLKKEIMADGLEKISEFFLLPDGTIFIKSGRIEGCGDLWYRYDDDLKEMVLIEKPVEFPYMIASALNPVEGMNEFPEGSYKIPYVTQELVQERYVEKISAYEGEKEQNISIKLPVFAKTVPGYERINGTLQNKMEELIQKGNKIVQQQPPEKKYYEIVPYYVYVDDRFTCVCYSETFGDNLEEQSTILFSSETGDELSMDDLFAVLRDQYLEFISFAVYKELEMQNGFNESFGRVKEDFNENILVTNYNIKNFILTKQGLVVFYPRYLIADGTERAPFFEISYDYLKPIMLH